MGNRFQDRRSLGQVAARAAATLGVALLAGCSSGPGRFALAPEHTYVGPITTFDGPIWRGTMETSLLTRDAFVSCTLLVASGVISGTYEGVPFLSTIVTASGRNQSGDSSDVLNLPLANGQASFLGYLERWPGSDRMHFFGRAVIAGDSDWTAIGDFANDLCDTCAAIP